MKNHFDVKKLSHYLMIVSLLTTLDVTTLFANTHESLYSQETRLDLKLSGTSIKEAFSKIEKMSEFVFFYSENVEAELRKNISINAISRTIEEILPEIIKETNLTYKLNDRQIIICQSKESPQAGKSIIINGTVIDVNRNPLPGVNITLKGTTTGTTTDVDGNFFLSVSGQSTILVFQYIGFKTQEVKVGRQINLTVTLEEDVTDLDEVVVVGFGSQKKLSVIGSITTIEPAQLQVGTTRSMSNNLAGQLAGVIGVQRSGEPGYDNSSFWIRGISTFAGNKNPLILVDGIERSLDNIDPAEIESFSILKDASASAMYGVRGANGVILVTTKRGQIGKPIVKVRFEQGFTNPVKLPDFLGAADYMDVMNSISDEAGETRQFLKERIDNTRNHTDSDLYPDVNWLDAITKDFGTNSRANLTISGGSNILRYAMVASFYNEGGIMERDKKQEWNSSSNLQRYNIRSNVDVDITPTTLVRVNIGGYLQDRKRAPQSVDDAFSQAFETPPFVHPTQYSTGEIPRVKERQNPWALMTQRGYERISASKIESLFGIEQNLKFILPGLMFKGTFSFDRFSENKVTRSKDPDYYLPATRRLDDGQLDLTIDTYGQVFLGYDKGSEWGNKSTYFEGNLSYSQNFGSHYVDAMFLYNQRHYDDGSTLPYRNQGIAGRLSYSYDRRYVSEINFGYNGSENFAKGKRFGFFPSVAVGWLLSEEKFMERYKDTFSKIKLRLSYGLVGNDRLDGRRFAYITSIDDTNSYRWGNENELYRLGRWEGDYGVSDLTWETVAKTNLGVELGLWNMLDLQVDLFKEQRRDIFMNRQTIPGSSGFVKTPWANFGKVDNQGIDISLFYNQQISKNWNVSLRGTFTYAVNEVVEKDEPLAVIGTNRAQKGHPVNQIFGLISEGLFTDGDFVNEGKNLAPGVPEHTYGPVRPGDIRYKDINGDGKITDLDRCQIGGTEDPQIVYGFGANVRYKNFDLGFFLQGNAKTWRMLGGNSFLPGSAKGAMGNIYTNVDDRWTVENPRQDVFWPRLANYDHANNKQSSTWWLKDMSMLRLKNIEIGYNFPNNLLKKVGIQSARVFANGNNLLTFSGFKLWDPELGSNNGFKYPIMKSVSVGLDINF